MIFPRKHFKSHMISQAPPDTLGLAAPSGWMNADLFCEVMDHFIRHTASSRENPCLLIYDNHESHMSINEITKAKSAGITLLTLPPHSSNKLQPLDVSIFGPLKKYYYSAVSSWMLKNPAETMKIYQVAECFGQAYLKALNPEAIRC